MIAGDILTRAGYVLNDESKVTWVAAEGLAWLNDAQRAIVNARPDASATTVSVALTAGVKQALPSGGQRLIRVTRNMGADGATPGAAVQLTDADSLASWVPNWATDTAQDYVENYLYDDRIPRTWWNYPPVNSGVYVELQYTQLPTDCTALTGDGSALYVSDAYADALLDYVLYRAFSKEGGQTGKAQAHLNGFHAALGLKTQSDLATSPKEPS